MSTPATRKQLDYIIALAKERRIFGVNANSPEEVIRLFITCADPVHPSTTEASKCIEQLLQIPIPPNPKALTALDALDTPPDFNQAFPDLQIIKPPSFQESPPFPPAQTRQEQDLNSLRNQIQSLREDVKSAVNIANVVAINSKEQLTPEKLEPLLKPIIEKALKNTAESIVLGVMAAPQGNLIPQGNPSNEAAASSSPSPLPSPPSIDPHFYFDPNATRAVLSALRLGKNFYIQGHTGCGKTQLIMQIHAKLGKGIKRINMDGDVTKRDFIGNMSLITNTNGESETTYIYGALPRAMLGGYTLLCDEFDKTPAHIAAVLHPVMEGAPTLYLPDTGETITAQKGFLIAATANTGGKGDSQGVYTGAEVQNAASLDRFGIMLQMDYLPQKEEVKLLIGKFPNRSPTHIALLVNLATHIRGAFARQELAATLSTRKIIDLLDLMNDGFTLTEALAMTFTNWLDDDDKGLAATFTDRLQIPTES